MCGNNIQKIRLPFQLVSVCVVIKLALTASVCFVEMRHMTSTLSRVLLSITDRDPKSDPACVLALEHYNTACGSGQEPWQAAIASFGSLRPSFGDPNFTNFLRSHMAFATIAARSQNPVDSARQCLRLIVKNAWQYCYISEKGFDAEEAVAADRFIKREPPPTDGQ